MNALDGLNTLAVPSVAADVRTVTAIEAFPALAELASEASLVVLGGGSNVVLGERIEQPVCLIRNRGVRACPRADGTEITVGAGEGWHDLVRWTLGRGLYGLENLALIPGSVGAAPVQNIGAYGVELERFVTAVHALDLHSGRMRWLSAADCQFGYRTSLFKRQPGRYVIGEVRMLIGRADHRTVSDYPDLALELSRMGVEHPAPVQVAEAVIRVRRRKLPDPRFVPNAGSFFRNPVVSAERYPQLVAEHGPLRSFAAAEGVKLAAAELIERCGFKGRQAGPIRVWQRQPLVLTNPGRRPASEVLAYAERIQAAVAGRFGIRLELEPDRIAC